MPQILDTVQMSLTKRNSMIYLFSLIMMLNQTEFSRQYYDTTATLDEWGA